MKKFFVTIAVIGIFILYGIYQKLALTPIDAATAQPDALNSTSSSSPSPSLDPTVTTIATTAPATTLPVTTLPATATPKPTSPPTTAPVNSGKYKNGTYTGSVADAYYGNVQVQAVVSGGKITNVVFLQYPSDRRNSQMINNQAMPILKSEAIQAQSANVNVVSGATDTSMAFIQSLGVALQNALN